MGIERLVGMSVNRPLQQKAFSSVESGAPELFTWENLLLMQGSSWAGTQAGCRQVGREYTTQWGSGMDSYDSTLIFLFL